MALFATCHHRLAALGMAFYVRRRNLPLYRGLAPKAGAESLGRAYGQSICSASCAGLRSIRLLRSIGS
jgi:hypothetical protein